MASSHHLTAVLSDSRNHFVFFISLILSRYPNKQKFQVMSLTPYTLDRSPIFAHRSASHGGIVLESTIRKCVLVGDILLLGLLLVLQQDAAGPILSDDFSL